MAVDKTVSNAELIDIYNREAEYINQRGINQVRPRLDKLVKKNKKSLQIYHEVMTTHEKNKFLVFYIISRKSAKQYDINVARYGLRDVEGGTQVFYRVFEGFCTSGVRENPLKSTNGLMIFQPHVFARYGERCHKEGMSEMELIIDMLMDIVEIKVSVDEYTKEIRLIHSEGLVLGTIEEDGTQVYRTFVNRLYENQHLYKAYANQYADEMRGEMVKKFVRTKRIKEGITI